MAIAGSRRVIRPGGTLLVALNGEDDKSELRALWQQAGTAALGPGFVVPHWSARADLDNAPSMIGRHFGSVKSSATWASSGSLNPVLSRLGQQPQERDGGCCHGRGMGGPWWARPAGPSRR